MLRNIKAISNRGNQQLLNVYINQIGVRFENTSSGEVEKFDFGREVVKFPTPGVASLKKGTGGRSSFNGTVVTVFGASGFLGRYVGNKLGKIGCQMIFPFRSDPYFYRHLKVMGDLGQVLFFPYYLRNEESIYKTVKYSNVVINLVGKDTETPSFTYDEVHVEGARTLAKVCRQAGVQRFIHVSALNCSPNPKPNTWFFKDGSPWLRSKYYGEVAVREEFPDAIIFRPSDIFGAEDRFFNFYVDITRRKPGVLLVWNKGIGSFKQPVYADDVAQGIVNAIFDNNAPGKTYDCVGPRRYEVYEMIRFFNRCLQKDEIYGWSIKDLKYHPKFWLRVAFMQYLFRYPKNGICLDKLEREIVTDTLTPGNPTLENLGVALTPMENHAWFELRPQRRMAYYPDDMEDLPRPAPPPYVVPLKDF